MRFWTYILPTKLWLWFFFEFRKIALVHVDIGGETFYGERQDNSFVIIKKESPDWDLHQYILPYGFWIWLTILLYAPQPASIDRETRFYWPIDNKHILVFYPPRSYNASCAT